MSKEIKTQQQLQREKLEGLVLNAIAAMEQSKELNQARIEAERNQILADEQKKAKLVSLQNFAREHYKALGKDLLTAQLISIDKRHFVIHPDAALANHCLEEVFTEK